MRTSTLVLIIVIIIIAFGLGWYLANNRKQSGYEDRPGTIEYKNDELGFSFEYPQEYGDVIVDFKQRPEVGEPFSQIFPTDGRTIKLVYFRGSFTNNPDFVFGGGYSCFDCEPELIDAYTGKSWFQNPENYQKIYSTDGKLGLLEKGDCPDSEEVFPCLLEDQFMASFLLDSDYDALSFIGEDTQINRDILSTLSFD